MVGNVTVQAGDCTGCRLCEMVCSLRGTGAYSPRMARIRIEGAGTGPFYDVRLCDQCEEALCIDACPVEALARDATTQAVVLDQEACTACGACADACPTASIFVSPDGEQYLKCDLCDGNPECVAICATGALSRPPD